jgi:hypothetical protein
MRASSTRGYRKEKRAADIERDETCPARVAFASSDALFDG